MPVSVCNVTLSCGWQYCDIDVSVSVCNATLSCGRQYCDIDVPEMGAVLAEAPTGEYCAELGWLRSGTEERVRTIITSHVDVCVASGSGGDGENRAGTNSSFAKRLNRWTQCKVGQRNVPLAD